MHPEFDPMNQEQDGGEVVLHTPVLVHAKDDEYQVGTPAEVCDTCSDFTSGRLVPASFCSSAKAKLGPEDWER